MKKPWVVTTGKGLVYIVMARTPEQAQTVFQTECPGAEVASIIQAEEVL
jgi:hypothetical protein